MLLSKSTYSNFALTAATLAVAMILAWPSTAVAALDALEKAYELEVGDVTLPAHAASSVVIRTCAAGDCDMEMLRVDSGTTYHMGPDDAAVTLAELRDAEKSDDQLIYVFTSTATGIVTRIILGRS